MTNTERRIKELKREIEKLRKTLRESGMNRSTLHNVKFNAQEQARRYDMALELSDKEDEIEELESLKIKEDLKTVTDKELVESLIKELPVKLTEAERKWWNWALEGHKSSLDDPQFVLDNPDLKTLAGQIEDIKYRLTEQSYDTAETDALSAELAGRVRVLNSLNSKLESFYKQAIPNIGTIKKEGLK